MKKLQIFIMIFIFLLPSATLTKLYSLQQLSDMVVDMSSATTLRIDGGISKEAEKSVNNNKDVINAILNVSEKNNVDISFVGYNTELSYFSEAKMTNYKRVIFTTFNKRRDFKLKSGRSLNKDDDGEKFLSSKDTGNKNQVGVLNWMNLGDIAEIRPWAAFEHTCFWLNSVIVHTRNHKILDNVMSELKNTYGLTFIKSIENDKGIYSSYVTTQSYRDLCYKIILIITSLYVLILIHNIFFRYKEFAVKKINGISNEKILSYIIYDAIKIISIGVVTTSAVLFTYLILKKENDIFGFFKVWIQGISLLSLILITINMLSIFLIIKINISTALKNKKPVKFLQNTNYLFKIVFCSMFISYITSNIIQLNMLLSGINSFKIWQEKTIDRVEPFGALFGDNSDGSWWDNETMLSYKKLYNKLDNEGKAIYTDFGHYKDSAGEESSIDKNIKFAKDRGEKNTPFTVYRSITVNNNYLKDNPIYDVNNERVNITDNSSDTATLLVLEDLKKYENDIVKEYENKIGDKTKKINIIYIKKDQQYFTYNLHVASKKNYILKDIPVVIVCNQNNLDLDNYCCYGLKLIKVNNPNKAYEEMLPYFKEVSLDNLFYSVRPVMFEINRSIYNMERGVIFTLFKLLFIIIALILLIISSSVNYIEKNKLKNSLLKIYGTPYLRRYIRFYSLLLLIWSLSYFISKDNMYFILTTKTTTISCLLDLIISTIFLKIYENKKISSVLKGE